MFVISLNHGIGQYAQDLPFLSQTLQAIDNQWKISTMSAGLDSDFGVGKFLEYERSQHEPSNFKEGCRYSRTDSCSPKGIGLDSGKHYDLKTFQAWANASGYKEKAPKRGS